jgi:hypothetical protein
MPQRDKGLRRHEREPQRVPVQIVWKDRDGLDRVLTGRTIDVSKNGMRVEVSSRIEERTYVTLRAEALKLHGSASVRRCARYGSKFMVGLEFSGGLQWKPPEPPKPPEAGK